MDPLWNSLLFLINICPYTPFKYFLFSNFIYIEYSIEMKITLINDFFHPYIIKTWSIINQVEILLFNL